MGWKTGELAEQGGDVIGRHRASDRRVLEEATAVEGEGDEGELLEWQLRVGTELGKQRPQGLGQSVQRVAVGGGVARVQFRVTCGDDSELEHREPPLGIGTRL